MAAIILGWNPRLWNGWNYEAVIDQIAQTGRFLERWNIGRHRKIQAGSQAWLFLQGADSHGRGLIGHGVVMSESYEAPQPAEAKGIARYVSVAFDALLPLGGQIPPSVLSTEVPGVPWDALRGSGSLLPPESEPGLHRVWREHGPMAPEPWQTVPGTYPEGAISRIETNRYEQDPEGRRICLAFHGTSCAVCAFSFEVSYGDIGKDFIQVHHVVPVSQLGAGYRLDPIADLVPLCANCHAMAHLGVSTPRTVAELRRAIAAAGHLPGQVVDDRALAAQDAAHRILEQR
ncbi:HNH endonuclease [Arthrobacter bambusae]|uniref:HNH endonuclease n=1 Tax=Arthrobacter bambusae TaxID=1338426 RepID=UPI0027811500|nr:HNH endonuclease [Arthrobacter bambusae]MDQ0028438.1 5-methylcytosine-specific restriction protein A [Arthrobacter bambusae]MDQ0096767.1 5-methylcytosine-specific restriction protein A [Arthrobacter bambusae]